jgi:hypothetical protein
MLFNSNVCVIIARTCKRSRVRYCCFRNDKNILQMLVSDHLSRCVKIDDVEDNGRVLAIEDSQYSIVSCQLSLE